MPGINAAYSAKLREFQMTVKGESEFSSIPGVVSDEISAGEAATETLETYEGTTSELGTPEPGNITIEHLAHPLDPVMQDLDAAYRDGSTRQFRIETKGEGTIFTSAAGKTAAWTAAGVVTFTGGEGNVDLSTDLVKRGDVLTVSTAKAVIRKITKSGDNYSMTVGKVPGGDALEVQATNTYTISRPNLRRGPFTARVAQFGAVSSSAGGNQTATTVLQPTAILPLPAPV